MSIINNTYNKMKKILINKRDEMVVVFLDNLAYMLADGSYTKLVYIGGMQTTLAMGISEMEEIITNAYKKKPSPFIRLGRSLILNQGFLYSINLIKHRITLSDTAKNILHIELPKPLLKKYKSLLVQKPANIQE